MPAVPCDDERMCGRYSVDMDPAELAEELSAELAARPTDATPLSPHYNVGPTREVPIVVRAPERRIGAAMFGWMDTHGHRHVNARAETLASQPAFAEAAARRRCLVPADGFYEWEHDGSRRLPWFFRASDAALLTFAGVFEVSRDELGQKHPRFVIVTVAATSPVAPIHDRMPLIVPPGLRDTWLLRDELPADEALRAIALAKPISLVSHRVDPRVGHADADDPSLRDPVRDTETGWLDFGNDAARRR